MPIEKREVEFVPEKQKEIEKELLKLRKQKEEIAQGRIELEKLAKGISDLKEEIAMDKQKIKPEDAIPFGDNGKINKVSEEKVFDPEEYEREQIALDKIRTAEMEGVVEEINSYEEGRDISDPEEYKSYNEYRKGKEAKTKNYVDKLIQAIADFDSKRERRGPVVVNSDEQKIDDLRKELKGEGKEKEENTKENHKAGDVVDLDIEKDSIKKAEGELKGESIMTKDKGVDYWESRKKIFEGKSPEEIRNILIREVELKKEIEIKDGPLSSRILSGVSKGIENWDNWGNKVDDKWGYIKRLSKMAVSLALIGVISSFAVDKLADTGVKVFSASALSGGTTSYLGRKMAFGLGIGSVMEGFKNMSPKKKKTLQIMMMAGSAGIAIASGGGILAGAAVGGAAAFGYGLSKLAQGKFSEEKIKARIEKIKKESVIDLDKIKETSEKFEKEYEEALRKAEKTRCYRKLAGGIASIIGSVAILEASGFVHDLHDTNVAIKTEEVKVEKLVDESNINKGQEQTIIQKEHNELPITDETRENGAMFNPKHLIQETKIETPETSTPDINNNLEPIDPNAIIHQGQGIEHAFIKQIENNPSLAEELGFKGDIDDAKALHEFAGRQAHVIAIKEGYVDNNTGQEVRIGEAGKVGYEIKMENGHVIVEEKTVGGEILDTHHEGDKFEDNLEKGEYLYKEGATDRDYQPSVQTNPSVNTETIPTNEEISSEFLRDNPQVSPINEVNTNLENLHEKITTPIENSEKLDNEVTKTPTDFNNGESREEVIQSDNGQVDHHNLSLEEQRQIDNVYEHNINQIFSDEKMNMWNEVKDLKAEKFYNYDLDKMKPEYKELYSYMHKLGEITETKPLGWDLFREPETNSEFIERALEKATILGKLKEVKL